MEIAKALTRRARVLIMDEPTAALSPVEAKRLFRVVETLRGEGAAIVVHLHRLEEVFAICQRVTVLRDGKRILSQPLTGLTPDDLVRAMVGRDVVAESHASRQAGEPVLEVEHLTREGVFVDISFEVRAGEVVALAGLVGSGRSEVAGRSSASTATTPARSRWPGAAAPGLARVGDARRHRLRPEDRRQQGLVMDMSVARNIGLASLKRLRHGGLIFARTERRFGADWAQRLQVKYGRASMPGLAAVRGQSAEGRAGQVAGPPRRC